jgi:anti-sigma regulatory factor (Ser/Thr protein kinase)
VIELVLPPRAESVPHARRAVDGLAASVPSHVLDDLRLLVSELVTNAVRHAGLRDDQAIVLRIEPGVASIRVEVRDDGAGFDLRAPAPGEGGSGWGLFLVSRLADRWGMANDGVTSVWFELAFDDD